MASSESSASQLTRCMAKLLTDLVDRNDQVRRDSCTACPASLHPLYLSLRLHPSELRRVIPNLGVVQLPLMPSQITPFHSSRPPAISVKSYLEDRSVCCSCLHNPMIYARTLNQHSGLLLCVQHPQICRVLRGDIHPRAHLHGSGGSVQSGLRHFVTQCPSPPHHISHGECLALATSS